MMSHLLQLLEGIAPKSRENVAREYLQVYVLRLLHERGAMTNMAFVGGTALRLLYRIPRFSEDLDFSALPERGAKTLAMEPLFRRITTDLEEAGYRMTVKMRTSGAPPSSRNSRHSTGTRSSQTCDRSSSARPISTR